MRLAIVFAALPLAFWLGFWVGDLTAQGRRWRRADRELEARFRQLKLDRRA